MRVRPGLFVLPLLLAAGPAAPDPVHELAGRYSHHFRNGLVTGETFYSDDVAEIVPVDARHAYVRFALNFYNGHECSLSGVAEAKGRELVYHDLGNVSGDGSICRLHITRGPKGLTWNDEDGTCKSYCGARGSFLGDSLPWASKRPISYLGRLKGSTDYRQAITEWRTGKPALP